MYKQNLSVMGVASCRSAFRLMVVRVMGFDPRCGPVRSSPARAPLAPPCPPHARLPLPQIRLAHLISLAQ
jgi:hypothetical protein